MDPTGGTGGVNAGGSAGASAGTGGDGTAGTATNGGTGGTGDGGSGGVASTGGASGAAGSGGDGGSGGGGSGAFTLTSPNHTDGAEFAAKYTCAEAGFQNSVLPELNWSGAPAGTMSFAITFFDTTLTEAQPPQDNGFHWAIINIPASTMSLPEGFTDAASLGATQFAPFTNYLGPCPALGMGPLPHNYEFTIYALPTAMISATGTGVQGVKNAYEAIKTAGPLASAKLTGVSSAAPPGGGFGF